MLKIYLIIGYFSFFFLILISKKFYKNSRYLEHKYTIDIAEIESIKGSNLYYSIKKGLFEIFTLMIPAVCFLLFILLEMDSYMEESEVKDVISLYLCILLSFMVISLLRSLFVLNYKFSIKNNKVFFYSPLGNFSFDLKEIKSVDLLTYHIFVETCNSKKFYLIPLGLSNIHIIYRLLYENCEFNNIVNSFNTDTSNVLYSSQNEYLNNIANVSIDSDNDISNNSVK